MNELAALLGGGILLYFGAEWFVGGASALALALRVPQIIVPEPILAVRRRRETAHHDLTERRSCPKRPGRCCTRRIAISSVS